MTRHYPHLAALSVTYWKRAYVDALLRRFPRMNPDRADELSDRAFADSRHDRPDDVAARAYVPGWSELERSRVPVVSLAAARPPGTTETR